MDAIKLVENCSNLLPIEMRSQPWNYIDHGRKVLNSEDELNAYIAAYGEIHTVKCRAALQNFPFEDLKMYSFEIFDWGCGQGIATLTLLDMLDERNLLFGLKKITLVEPSLPALERAKKWTEQFAGPGVDVCIVNKYIPSTEVESMDEVSCAHQVSINLMSNILDIKSVSLKWMAQKTSTLAVRNYMICVGPKFSNGTKNRIDDFCGYFYKKDYFSCINTYPYAYTTRTHHPFGCETRCFLHHKEENINVLYSECANEEDFSDDYDYATSCLKGIVSDSLRCLYNRVRTKCDMSYNIFLRPIIGSDVVDLVMTSVDKGIILLNVCEDISDLENDYFRIGTIKEHIFNVVLKTIKYDSIINKSVFGCIKVGLYVPNISEKELRKAISDVNTKMNEGKKQPKSQEKDYFEHFIFVLDSDESVDSLKRIKSQNFKFDYYDEFVKAIVGNWHSYKEGNANFKLSKTQEKIVDEQKKRIRCKGVAGCGKTQIVANRAVKQHLRTGEKVLIITYNITLIQYIKMRIMQVRADFSTDMFEIVNYHQFFKSKSNLYVKKSKLELSDWDDKDFFKSYSDVIQRYKTIIIDEVQDFKEAWLYSIITYFLAEDGSISVFGDGEQNVYDREMEKESKMPPMRDVKFSGRWQEINERVSLRIQNPQIATLASMFANKFISIDIPPIILQENLFNKYSVKYWNITTDKNQEDLSKNIKWIMDTYKLNPKDVVVMAGTIELLRDLAYYYTKQTNEKVMLAFESKEQYDEVRREKDIKSIRRAAKTHFTTYCEELKLCTIQSFKGWESQSVILFLEKDSEEQNVTNNSIGNKKINMSALIYTALTRAKCNLFIINLGNDKYHDFFKNRIRKN